MQIRAVAEEDLDRLLEIDGTVDSSHYLHVEKTGEGLAVGWRIEQRPLRQKTQYPNRLTDDQRFCLRQIVEGMVDGVALLAEHAGANVALLYAEHRLDFRTLKIEDLRVDFDFRRQGLATALIFQTIAEARRLEFRAVHMETRTDNSPVANLLTKAGFELAGLDTQRHSNHDLVKESATLLWYAPLD